MGQWSRAKSCGESKEKTDGAESLRAHSGRRVVGRHPTTKWDQLGIDQTGGFRGHSPVAPTPAFLCHLRPLQVHRISLPSQCPLHGIAVVRRSRSALVMELPLAGLAELSALADSTPCKTTQGTAHLEKGAAPGGSQTLVTRSRRIPIGTPIHRMRMVMRPLVGAPKCPLMIQIPR